MSKIGLSGLQLRLLKPRIMIVPTHKDECEEKQVTEKCVDILERIQDHEKREMKRLDSEMKKLEKKKCPPKEMGFDVEPELGEFKVDKESPTHHFFKVVAWRKTSKVQGKRNILKLLMCILLYSIQENFLEEILSSWFYFDGCS